GIGRAPIVSVLAGANGGVGSQPDQVRIRRGDGHKLPFFILFAHLLGAQDFRRAPAMNFRMTVGKCDTARAAVITSRHIWDLIRSHIDREFAVVDAIVAFIGKNQGITWAEVAKSGAVDLARFTE